MKSAVTINHLNQYYGDRPILRDISFSVDIGDFFVIIGPNGSGKTTLLKSIAGIIKSRYDSLTILDRPFHSYSRNQSAKIIALVPQLTQVDFPFTVGEVVLMGRAPHLGMLGVERREDVEIARRAMAFTGVEHLSDRKLDQLSGGEQQRVFIARAICQEPRIILLDEPTAALDLSHQVRVMDLMEKLKIEKDVTIIMVSHDVNLAAMYGDRLLLLRSGEIVGIGPSHEVLTYETLEETYDCTLLVDKSPIGEFPRVTLVPERYIEDHYRKRNEGQKEK